MAFLVGTDQMGAKSGVSTRELYVDGHRPAAEDSREVPDSMLRYDGAFAPLWPGGYKVLDKLKEYKELIAILVFFLGGVFWLQNQFPTKSDLKADVAVLQCLLDKYMTLTQLQIRERDLEKQVHDIAAQLAEFSNPPRGAAPALSPAMKQNLEDKKSELADKKDKLKKVNDNMQKTTDDLGRNVCGTPKQ